MESSSITACNNLVQCSLGALMVSVIDLIVNAVGPGWTYVLLAGICLDVTDYLKIWEIPPQAAVLGTIKGVGPKFSFVAARSSSTLLLPFSLPIPPIDNEEIREGTFGAYTSANASATMTPAPHFNPKPVDISTAYHEETEKDERRDSTLDGESHCSLPFGWPCPALRCMLFSLVVIFNGVLQHSTSSLLYFYSFNTNVNIYTYLCCVKAQ
ncbi:hypothetical protein BDR05DRAFT_1047209 [Suillus weaverae]|nr:hypothetical protein BDR05DRAFT_1047209 [Suillus weaverae]